MNEEKLYKVSIALREKLILKQKIVMVLLIITLGVTNYLIGFSLINILVVCAIAILVIPFTFSMRCSWGDTVDILSDKIELSSNEEITNRIPLKELERISINKNNIIIAWLGNKNGKLVKKSTSISKEGFSSDAWQVLVSHIDKLKNENLG